MRAKLQAYIGAATFDNDVYANDARLARLMRHGMAYFDLASHAPLAFLPGRSTGNSSSSSRNNPSSSSVGENAYACCATGQGGFMRRAKGSEGGPGFRRTPRGDPAFAASLPWFVQRQQAAAAETAAKTGPGAGLGGTFGSIVATDGDGTEAAAVDEAREVFMLNQVFDQEHLLTIE